SATSATPPISTGVCAMTERPSTDYVPSLEPTVPVPLPAHGGAPPCPVCGYSCGCCCYHDCQTPCMAPDSDGDCDCGASCHGGHKPWDCLAFGTRYSWAKAKADRAQIDGSGASPE